MMKRLFLTMLSVLIVAQSSMANESYKEREALAKEMVKHETELYAETLDMTIQEYLKEIKDPRQKEAFEIALKRSFDVKDLTDIAVKVSATFMTVDEIQSSIDFYKTEAGRNYLDAQPEMERVKASLGLAGKYDCFGSQPFPEDVIDCDQVKKNFDWYQKKLGALAKVQALSSYKALQESLKQLPPEMAEQIIAEQLPKMEMAERDAIYAFTVTLDKDTAEAVNQWMLTDEGQSITAKTPDMSIQMGQFMQQKFLEMASYLRQEMVSRGLTSPQ